MSIAAFYLNANFSSTEMTYCVQQQKRKSKLKLRCNQTLTLKLKLQNIYHIDPVYRKSLY